MAFSLDRRTRCDAQKLPIVLPADFFFAQFPVLAAANGAIAAAGFVALAAPPLSLKVEGSCWTIDCANGSLVVRAGLADNALVITLTRQQFTDWAQNEISLNGFLVARTLVFRGGTRRDVSVWDSLWIALLEGWPVIDPDFAFVDRRGEPLDLDRCFSPTDSTADMAHFLREAGYIHLRGWVDLQDIAAISRDMERARPDYSEGDNKSWWAELNDGTRVCVRMQEFVGRSPATARILSGHAWEAMICALEGPDAMARKPVEGRIVEALFKPVGVVSGPSDLSFHRDCHLGRHAYACARMTVGIAITSADKSNGQLRVVAGSHRLVMPVDVAGTEPYLPVVALQTEPGDLTVHLSCTLHEATAPVSAERRVLYTEIPLRQPDGGTIDTTVSLLREQVTTRPRDIQ